MLPGWVSVLDIGKTLAKLSLWDERGRLLSRLETPSSEAEAYVDGIERIRSMLRRAMEDGPIGSHARGLRRAWRTANPVRARPSKTPGRATHFSFGLRGHHTTLAARYAKHATCHTEMSLFQRRGRSDMNGERQLP